MTFHSLKAGHGYRQYVRDANNVGRAGPMIKTHRVDDQELFFDCNGRRR